MDGGPPTKAEIGVWLRRHRLQARAAASPEKRRGFAQAGIAEFAGVRERAVRDWEKGNTSPDADVFFRLAALYGADVRELLNGNAAADDELDDTLRDKRLRRAQEKVEKDYHRTHKRRSEDRSA